MPWREASPMDQRTQFIADHLREALSITELCALYGISRKTGYKWIDRYLVHSLLPRSARTRRRTRLRHQTLAVNCHPCCRFILLPMFPLLTGHYSGA
jgi:transposase-like protein